MDIDRFDMDEYLKVQCGHCGHIQKQQISTPGKAPLGRFKCRSCGEWNGITFGKEQRMKTSVKKGFERHSGSGGFVDEVVTGKVRDPP